MKKYYREFQVFKLLLLLLLGLPGQLLAQSTTISGTVRSATDQQILPGVTVAVKNTQMGTTTDERGRYQIPEVPNNAVLVFSFVGFKSLERPVGSNTTLDVTLEEDNAQLEEVVVVGYGTQKKREVTGAVASIKSEDITKVATNSFTSAIQGKVPGVFIAQTSGAPGGSASVRIRGVGTTGGNEPLYVVDGMPLGGGSMGISGSSDRVDGLSVINPNDIESIEVLKDAAAAAIYGARAANGVILITTKRGKEGQAKVSLDAYTGVQQLWKKPEFLNAQEFTTLANELYTNSGMTPNPEWANPASFGEGTNWIDQVFRTAPVQNYDVSVNGGTQKLKGALSLGYRDQEGTIMETWYKRYTGRASADLQANDKLSFGSSLSFSYSQAKGQQNQDLRIGIFNLAQQFYPTLGREDVVNGSSAYYTTQGDNPYLRAKSIDNQVNNFRVFGNAFGVYEIIPGLKFRSSVGLDVNNNRASTWEPRAERGHYRNLQATLGETYTQGLNWLLENTLSYTKVFGEHSVSAVVGQTAQNNNNNWVSVTAREYQNEQIRVINSSNENNRRASGTGSEYTLASYLARVNYAFKDRYLLSASIRRDGSSNFGPNNKWGNFPSVSAGWNITEESFMQQQTFISNLKIRGSWGRLGNDAITPFGYLSTIRLGTVNDNYVLGLNQGLVIGATMSKPGNPDLKWETSEQTNIGIEASFLNNRIYLTSDYYIKNTKDMLISLPVSIEAGFQSAPSINGGKVQNKGLELLLGYQNDIGAFHFDVSGNLATLRNEVMSLGVGQPITGPSVTNYFTVNATYTEVGQPIGYFRGFIVDGIYQTNDEVNKTLQPNAVAGDFKFRDINGDNVLSDADRVKIGNPWPTLMYGSNIDMSYKGFDLNIMLQGVAGNDIFHANKRSAYPLKYFGGTGVVNGSKNVLNRWTPGSGRNDVPRLAYTDSNGNFGNSSSFYVEDGDYMRIRNLTLGYRLPGDLIRKTGLVQNARIYVNAQNLFTFTKYSGFDPEVGSTNPMMAGIDDGVYPQPRTLMVGVNLSF
ncbi:SusC/RagA family TonB-linked outer membrane protein [Adhaeribacter aerolatus]|uniref:SusC/RagA family TonB-linked outer membrane protein n=1 Tax=Adhaeribacter aerolatus TaxID=670289 RepID=A0A512B5P0_9BACT|nr:TonB-dependent receptor [Adhaeribacter aerolatus]GEO07286.1 SusC/RagA family TonB-linked outer membrane protein [Adhaeribacter aerolatus]